MSRVSSFSKRAATHRNHLQEGIPEGELRNTVASQSFGRSDFLVGLTFPVGDEHCSFICGGWGGGLAGISSIDGNDASENQTTQFRDIKNNKWYRFVVKVDSKTITVTMDGEQIIEVPREGKSFTVRGEVRASRPLGYCVFASKVAVKDFEYRSLAKEGKEGK